MSDICVLDRMFAKQSPNGAWEMLRDWFPLISMVTHVKWSDAFNGMQIEKGEEPLKFFIRVDEIAGVLRLVYDRNP